MKKSIGMIVNVVLKAMLTVFVFTLLLNVFVFSTSIVQGKSMMPILEEGDRVIFNKTAYTFNEPERGDIVIIQRPLKNYVKRIVGLPGETVEVKEHKLFIDGERYKQNFLAEKEIHRTLDFGPVIVPSNSYFVMGDNRMISKDSRNGLGFVTNKEIAGRLELVLYPFSEFSFTR